MSKLKPCKNGHLAMRWAKCHSVVVRSAETQYVVAPGRIAEPLPHYSRQVSDRAASGIFRITLDAPGRQFLNSGDIESVLLLKDAVGEGFMGVAVEHRDLSLHDDLAVVK